MPKARSRATVLHEPKALVLHSTARALDPHRLHEETEEAVRALFEEGESANTSRSYSSALKYWAAWYRLRFRLTLSPPVPVPAVIQFIVDHVERTTTEGSLKNQLRAALDRLLVEGGFKGVDGALALNTVVHRLSVLSKTHVIKDSAESGARPCGSGASAASAPGLCLSGCPAEPKNRADQGPSGSDAGDLHRWTHRRAR